MASRVLADSRPLASLLVPCTTTLRNGVLALCDRHALSPSALACTALALVGERPELAGADPGPGVAERVQVVLDSGKTRIVHVTPSLRLQVPKGNTPAHLRVALAVALTQFTPAPLPKADPVQEVVQLREEAVLLREQVTRLREAMESLAPPVLPQPPSNAAQSAWLMGFASEWGLTADKVTARYRQLARIYHPDSGIAADVNRMAQLTAARALLMRQVAS